MRHIVIIALMLMTLISVAERPLYQAWITLDDVQVVSSGVWRVSGNVSDYSALGYTALDTETNNLLFAQSDSGIVDMYTVVSVVTATTVRATFDVAETTNSWPVSGAPGTGKQVLCARSGGSVFLPSFTANQADEYLVRQAQNLSGFLLPSGGSGGASLGWLTNLLYVSVGGTTTVSVIHANATTSTAFKVFE